MGGVWRPDHHWDTLTTNSSYPMMALGDFPFPFAPAGGDFPTRAEICRYVEEYAARFGVLQLLRFNATVVQVEPLRPLDAATTPCRATW